MPSLTSPKAERFAQELARGTDYKEAYVKAGYKESRTNAHSLSQREDVQARVEELFRLEAEAQGVTLESVVAEMKAIAFANARDFFHWDERGVRVHNSDALTEAQSKAIVGVKETRSKGEVTIEVKLGDKLTALDKLYRHLKPAADSGDQHLHLHVESPLAILESRMALLSSRGGAPSGPVSFDGRTGRSAELGLVVLGTPKTIDAEPSGVREPDRTST